MPNERRIYWDSNLFIARIERTPDRIDVLEHITSRAERDEIEIVTSTFTLCEVAKVGGGFLPEEQEKLIVDFFENPYIVLVQVDRFVAELARDIIRRFTGIKGKDAVHIASAIRADVSVMHSYDESHILNKNGQIGNPPLKIEKPDWKGGQRPLIP